MWCMIMAAALGISARAPEVPYVPGYLESEGHEETMWYAAAVDGALEGILDSGVVPPGDPLEDWVCSNLEDNLFVMAPNRANEADFLGHGCAYLRRNQPQRATYEVATESVALPTGVSRAHVDAAIQRGPYP